MNFNILIADPNSSRRRVILDHCAELGIDSVVDASTLGQIYHCIETHRPKKVALASDFLRASEFSVLRRMLEMSSSELILFGDKPLTNSYRVFRVDDNDTAKRLAARLLFGLASKCSTQTNLTSSHRSLQRNEPLVNKLLLIGASTGGVTALETILAEFPENCPPTLIVQHMLAGFSEGFIGRLQKTVRPVVIAAEDGAPLQQGVIHVAAGNGLHLGITKHGRLQIRLIKGKPVSGHCPSVDVLFEQAANLMGEMSIRAAILTGMGADGAAGMRRLREAGAYTVAQDQDTSTVWGMPRVAIELGGATEVLPLTHIARALLGSDLVLD